MTDGNRRFNKAGLNAAAALISVAVAIVVSFALNNWWVFIPVLLLEVGLFLLVLGLSLGRPGPGCPGRGPTRTTTCSGQSADSDRGLSVLNTFIPGNVVILVVVFLIWMASALLFSIRKKSF